MLKVVNDDALGSHPIISPTSKPHIQLDFPSPKKRLFPKEFKTETPKLNSNPRSYALPNEKPSPKNGYSNSYPSSNTKLTFHEANQFTLSYNKWTQEMATAQESS